MSLKVQTTNGQHTTTEPSVALPSANVHLETIDRMMELPVVDATWQQTQMVYGRVKDSNRVLTWAFGMAENVVCQAATISAPLVQRLDRPLHFVDQTLVHVLDRLEVNAPIVKEQPAEIYQQARTRVLETVKPHIDRVCELRSASKQRVTSLKDLSWRKANDVLATQYGCLAVNGIDTTASVAERLLDYYFPKTDEDSEDTKSPVGAKEDPVLHTVQTVGRLSNKVACRVYHTVSQRVKSLGLQNVRDYVATLIAVLRLTQYLNFVNEKHSMVKADTSVKCDAAVTTPASSSTSSASPKTVASPKKAASPKTAAVTTIPKQQQQQQQQQQKQQKQQ